MDACIFCAILAGDAPATVVDRGARTVALLTPFPYNPGHALVIPAAHVGWLRDLDDALATEMVLTARRVAARVRAVSGCDWVQLLLNDNLDDAEAAAFHLHLHVIPRFDEDDVDLETRPPEVERAELERFAERLRDEAATV